MGKKAAVLVVNPVNGLGLFQYLESFYENSISFKTFAVSGTTQVKTNSGISLKTDDVIANLKLHESEYDVLVFSCGDAIPQFNENASKQFNQDLMTVIKSFDEKGKILAGHCAAALLFDKLRIGKGKKVACHQLVQPALQNCIPTDEESVIDGNLYTAQTEQTLSSLMPDLIKALKQ